MKIAIIGKFYTEAFGLHLQETIENMGHEVLAIDPELDFSKAFPSMGRVQNVSKTLYQEVFYKLPKIRNIASKRIYTKLAGEKIDLIISLHDFLNRDEVKSIKRITKAPVCIWFPDALSNFQKSMFFYAGYDYYFFKDKYLVKLLKEEFNLNTYYLPQCANPKKHRPVETTAEEKEFYGCQITNAGNLYPSRALLLSQLLDYEIKLWGKLPPIWLNSSDLKHIVMGREVFNEEKSKAFSLAKIVLNNLHPAEINGLNKRSFEVALCGGFQITNYRECSSTHFEIGKEIVCYSSFDDLKEKIEYYLDSSNEAERLEIIEAGQKRVLKDHTYLNRVHHILKIVFGE